MLHWWRSVSATVISAEIFSFITGSTTSTVGCSLVNSNVWVKFIAKLYHSMVPCRSSSDVYQLCGTISKVWMNRWTHSCHGYACQAMWQCSICFPGYDNPVYYLSTSLASSPNMISISLLHCGHSKIDCLCLPHHLAGVAFNTKSKEDNCSDSVTFASNSIKKDVKLGKPWYVGSSLSSAPTYCIGLVILAHLHM